MVLRCSPGICKLYFVVKKNHYTNISIFDFPGDGISCTDLFCNNNAHFSTYDNDNGAVTIHNNAVTWHGAWWYNDGHRSVRKQHPWTWD